MKGKGWGFYLNSEGKKIRILKKGRVRKTKKINLGKDDGYCVRCKGKRKMKDVKFMKATKNIPARMRGVCPKCDAKMVKFVKS